VRPARGQPCSHGELGLPSALINPARLQGEALRRWYARSPQEVEQEREAIAASRYADFFSGAGRVNRDPDPGFSRGSEVAAKDIDPVFCRELRTTPREVDPGFSWAPAGPNRWHGDRQVNAPLSQANVSRPPSPNAGTTAAKARGVAPRPASTGGDAGVWYGNLYAPPPDDLPELRRQQAEFGRVTREIDKQNSWFAIPALAPAAVPLILEGGAALAARAAAPRALSGALNFAEREAWQGSQRAGQALTEEAKAALRRAARARLGRANNISASDMQAEVHHFDPLEWAHVKPNADPNRLANLGALRGEAHDIASKAWGEFRSALKGRLPTQAELHEATMRINRMVEPYIRRAGVPRSNTPPRQGDQYDDHRL